MKDKTKKGNAGIVLLICLLFVVVIAMGVYMVLDKTDSANSGHENELDNGANSNIVDKDNVSDNINDKYKAYSVGDKITLSDGSTWQVIKESKVTDDYVTVLGEEDYYEYLEIESADLYNRHIEYKGSALDKAMQSQQSRIPAKLKEVDGYKIRLITLDEIFAIDNNWERTDSDGYLAAYKYTESEWSGKVPVGINTMTPVTLTDNYEGSYLAFYKIISTECWSAECTKTYYVSRSDSGLGGFYPVANIYKDSI